MAGRKKGDWVKRDGTWVQVRGLPEQKEPVKKPVKKGK